MQTRRRRRPWRLRVSAALTAPVSATSSRTMCTTCSSGAISVWRTRDSNRSRVRSARRPRTASSCRPATRPRIGKSDSASSPTAPTSARIQSEATDDTDDAEPAKGTRMTSCPAGPCAHSGTDPSRRISARAVDPERVQPLGGLVDRCAGQRRVEQEISGEVALVNSGVDVEPHRRRLDERLRELPFSHRSRRDAEGTAAWRAAVSTADARR